jgi:hypothetical protein
MAVRIVCTGCGKVLNVPSKRAAPRIQCPGCKTLLALPEEGASGLERGPLLYRRIRRSSPVVWIVLPAALVAGIAGLLLLGKPVLRWVSTIGSAHEESAGPVAVVPGGKTAPPVVPQGPPRWLQRRADGQSAAGGEARPGRPEGASGAGYPGGGRSLAEHQELLSRVLAGLLRDSVPGRQPGRRIMPAGMAMATRVDGYPYRCNVLSRFPVAMDRLAVPTADEAFLCASNTWELGAGDPLEVGTRVFYRNGRFEAAGPTDEEARRAATADIVARVDAAVMVDDFEGAARILAGGEERFPRSEALAARRRRLEADRRRATITVVNVDGSLDLTLVLQKLGNVVVSRRVRAGEIAQIEVNRTDFVGRWSGSGTEVTRTVDVDGWQTWEFWVDAGDGEPSARRVWRRRVTSPRRSARPQPQGTPD